MGTKKVTVADFLDALEADNVELKRGGWFGNQEKVQALHVQAVGAACILGVGCVNLGVTNGSLQTALDKVVAGSSSRIISLNDSTNAPYPSMVKTARNIFKGKENEILTLETTAYLVKLVKTENA